MPKTSEMRESKFLKKEDIPSPAALWTVSGIKQYNVAMQGAEPEMKWCLTFEDTDKPLVLNATNIHICEQAFGSDDTDDWVGQQIVLYVDPNVSYGGKLVGGIRCRKPKAQKAKPTPPVEPLTDDDIPF